VKVLVTGAGGPAAIAVMRSLEKDFSVTLVAADMDPWASGLYLAAPENRAILPAGGSEEFVDELLTLCLHQEIAILVSTVDAELEPVAKNSERFSAIGTKILGAPLEVLQKTLDKLTLIQSCSTVVRTPRTELASQTDISTWTFPVLVKPRRGSGGRGVVVLHAPQDFLAMDSLPGLIVQEFLPGEEYSIDVLATRNGIPIAAVPRLRARVDSGIAVAGYSICDEVLESFAKKVVTTLKIPYISNVQVRRATNGEPALMEVNPRVPGSLALTRAAGVDMVRLAVDELRGKPFPLHIAHREVAMVRFLSDLILEKNELVVGAIPIETLEPQPALPSVPIPLSA
jgi:carbamoyl-phosphate synthase large subunit